MDQEILDRVRRIETRLHIMCKGLNIETGSIQGAAVKLLIPNGRLPELHMTGIDVPLSRIKCILSDADISEALLFHNSHLLGSIRINLP